VIVRVVLDTSALVAYARLNGIATGELIAMVEEDGGANLVGIPAASLLAAYAVLDADERTRLVDLATKIDGVTVILPLLGTDTIEVAELETRFPVRGTAHAIVETRKRGALLATRDAVLARKELPDEFVLDLD
jgi:hypothetical protein